MVAKNAAIAVKNKAPQQATLKRRRRLFWLINVVSLVFIALLKLIIQLALPKLQNKRVLLILLLAERGLIDNQRSFDTSRGDRP